MTPEQKYAIQILTSIIQPMAKSKRGTALLCSVAPREEYKGWTDEEFCRGWAFAVGAHLADALDIILQQRKRNKKAYFVWTQSSAFDFKQGYTIYRADSGMALQVQDAKAAVPGRNGMKRDAGYVLIQCYRPIDGPTVWEKSSTIAMTQDDFIRFLINGEHTSGG